MLLIYLEKDSSLGIPNNFPFKEELLLQAEEEKRRVIILNIYY